MDEIYKCTFWIYHQFSKLPPLTRQSGWYLPTFAYWHGKKEAKKVQSNQFLLSVFAPSEDKLLINLARCTLTSTIYFSKCAASRSSQFKKCTKKTYKEEPHFLRACWISNMHGSLRLVNWLVNVSYAHLQLLAEFWGRHWEKHLWIVTWPTYHHLAKLHCTAWHAPSWSPFKPFSSSR